MQLSAPEYALWVTTTFLKVLVCTLALRHRLFARLPFFTIYLVLTTAREILFWWLYHSFGYHSTIAFYGFWVSQAVLLGGRAAVVAELTWRALRGYRGVWALGWRLLCFFGLILLFHAAMDARGNASFLVGFIVTAERDLELAIAGILVALLATGRYYRIPFDPVQRMVALGLGFYSAVQVLNNGLPREWQTLYFDWWNAIRVITFQATLVIWLWALRKPLPAAAPAPELLPQDIYDELSPQVNYRLRVLNERLLEILKS